MRIWRKFYLSILRINHPSSISPMMVIINIKTLEHICTNKYLDKEQLLKKTFFFFFYWNKLKPCLERKEHHGVNLCFCGQDSSTTMPCYQSSAQCLFLKEQVSWWLWHQYLQSSNHWPVGYAMYNCEDCLGEKIETQACPPKLQL